VFGTLLGGFSRLGARVGLTIGLVNRLIGRLGVLGRISILIPVAFEVRKLIGKTGDIRSFFQRNIPGLAALQHLSDKLPGTKQINEALGINTQQQIDPSLSASSGLGVHGALLENVRRRERLRASAIAAANAARLTAAAAQRRAEAAFSRRISLFNIASTRAQLTQELNDDNRVLRDELRFLRLELRNHNLSATTRLQVEQQIADTEVQLAQNQATIRQQAQERAARIRERALARRNARQFKVLGLGPTGDTLAPSKKALRVELGSVSDVIKGTFLDTGRTRNLLRSIRRLLSGELGALSADVRNKVKELLDDLKGQITDFDGFNLTQADKRRRFLDKQRADRFGGKADHPVIGSSTVNNTYNINAKDPNDWVKASKRINWRMANA
jgi:hypothetical protein